MLRYYIWIICICMAIISGINIAVFYPLGEITIPYAILSVPLTTILVIILDGIIASIVRFLPRKWFSPYIKFYKTSEKEKKFFNKIKLRKWKDKVPEMGKYLCNFDKREVASNTDKYLYKFLEETCYAEILHYGMALIGFALLFFAPAQFVWTITFPVVMVNFVLQFPPIWIQRFNRPKLLIAYERSLKKNTDLKS